MFGNISVMSSTDQPDNLSLFAAEEVLRKIFGDDLKGCHVTLNDVALIIQQALRQRALRDHEVVELYEKLVDALNLLSTPPPVEAVPDADKLKTLLSDRMDKVHTLTTRMIQTSNLLKGIKSKTAE